MSFVEIKTFEYFNFLKNLLNLLNNSCYSSYPSIDLLYDKANIIQQYFTKIISIIYCIIFIFIIFTDWIFHTSLHPTPPQETLQKISNFMMEGPCPQGIKRFEPTSMTFICFILFSLCSRIKTLFFLLLLFLLFFLST